LGDVRAQRGALASPETDRLLHVGLRLKPRGPRQHTKELHNLTSKGIELPTALQLPYLVTEAVHLIFFQTKQAGCSCSVLPRFISPLKISGSSASSHTAWSTTHQSRQDRVFDKRRTLQNKEEQELYSPALQTAPKTPELAQTSGEQK
jgi:hypothetical protein